MSGGHLGQWGTTCNQPNTHFPLAAHALASQSFDGHMLHHTCSNISSLMASQSALCLHTRQEAVAKDPEIKTKTNRSFMWEIKAIRHTWSQPQQQHFFLYSMSMSMWACGLYTVTLNNLLDSRHLLQCIDILRVVSQQPSLLIQHWDEPVTWRRLKLAWVNLLRNKVTRGEIKPSLTFTGSYRFSSGSADVFVKP